ncbi:hypothetical protein OQA88_4777 [Cercophora sp. LCS_1]
MSSSQNPDHPPRPESGTSNSTAATSPKKAYKAYGQDYQYAERLSNPLPEFVIGSFDPVAVASTSAAVPGAALGNTEQADGANEERQLSGGTLSNDQSGSFKESPMRESIWIDPPRRPWHKRIPIFWRLVIIVSLLGITGVILAILGAMGLLGAHSDDSSTPSATMTTSTTSNHPDICNSSSFFHFVKWAGIAGGEPLCAGWTFDGGNRFTPCTKIMVTTTGSDKTTDDTCPAGYADIISFTKGGSWDGGIGPCVKKAKLTP